MGKRILVISDDQKFCEAIKANLEKETCQVQVEMKLDQVLANAHIFKPEAVIVDISQSNFNSAEVAYKIRNDQKLYKAALIFLSLFAKKDDTELYVGLVDGRPFIAKPIHPKVNKAKEVLKWIEEAPANPLPAPPAE